MITQIIVGAGEGPLGGLFVDRNHADRRVIAVPVGDAGDDRGISAGEVVIIVRLPIDLRAVRDSRQRVDRPIFLHEGRVGSPTVAGIRSRTRLVGIFEPDGPEERQRRRVRCASGWDTPREIDRRVKQLDAGRICRGCGVVLEEEEHAPRWHVKAVQTSFAFFVVIEKGEGRIRCDGRDHMSSDWGAIRERLCAGRHRQQAGWNYPSAAWVRM